MSVMQEQARSRMMKQKGYDKTNSYWDNLRGKPRDYENSGMEYVNTKEGCIVFIIRNNT
jgi:hypothetical protein